MKRINDIVDEMTIILENNEILEDEEVFSICNKPINKDDKKYLKESIHFGKNLSISMNKKIALKKLLYLKIADSYKIYNNKPMTMKYNKDYSPIL